MKSIYITPFISLHKAERIFSNSPTQCCWCHNLASHSVFKIFTILIHQRQRRSFQPIASLV